MASGGFTLFETAIGTCGLAWNERGVVGVQLPEANASSVAAWLRRRFPASREMSPPARIQRVCDDLVALLAGAPVDLQAVSVDLERSPEFERRVYEVVRTIPAGATLTYGEIATRLGDPDAVRAVGAALGRNPCPLVVPCHRVVAAGGTLGGFSAYGGVATKA